MLATPNGLLSTRAPKNYKCTHPTAIQHTLHTIQLVQFPYSHYILGTTKNNQLTCGRLDFMVLSNITRDDCYLMILEVTGVGV